ncbi:MAG: DUF1844 domain-containing protein [Candidatus Omnitrophota bacterium]
MGDEKYVDEGWKESMAKQKDTESAPKQETQASSETKQTEEHIPGDDSLEINFLSYMTSLAYQAMVFLGEIPNPLDNKVEKNLQQAKLLIDTLSMLKDKTKGNLNHQEDVALGQLLYELQMKYVDVLNQEGSK